MDENRNGSIVTSISLETLGFLVWLVFLILSLTVKVDGVYFLGGWQGFWVWFPLWFPFALAAVVYLLIFIVAFIVGLISNR